MWATYAPSSSEPGIGGKRAGGAPLLFLDEIHRFSKSQQDALLHAVEDGILVLIGATTENPYISSHPGPHLPV